MTTATNEFLNQSIKRIQMDANRMRADDPPELLRAPRVLLLAGINDLGTALECIERAERDVDAWRLCEPETLRKKAERLEGVTNVTQEENQEKLSNSGELEKLENEVTHGGARKNAGRKPKEYQKIQTEFFGDLEGTESFCEAFELFYTQVQNAQLEKWQNVPKRSAIYCIKLLTDLIGE